MTKLPKPKGQRLAYRCVAGDGEDEYEDFYTEAQMLQFRRDALEEAADTLEHGFVDDEGHHIEYAAEIRKLKDET